MSSPSREFELHLEVLREFASAAELGETHALDLELPRCSNCGKPCELARSMCIGCLASNAERQRRFAARGRARRDAFRREHGIVRDCGVWTVRRDE